MWCWWCCHPFEGTPLNMPVKYDDRRKTFNTTGNFCSWSCMKTYALDKYGCGKGSMITSNMVMMRRRMYEKQALDRVVPAPWRYRLKVFGGDMTIEDYRQIDNGSFPNDIMLDPIFPVNHSVYDYEAKCKPSENYEYNLHRKTPLKKNKSILGKMNIS